MHATPRIDPAVIQDEPVLFVPAGGLTFDLIDPLQLAVALGRPPEAA